MTVIDTGPPPNIDPPATIVHLSGDIDLFTTAQLRQRLLNTLPRSTALLVLDMSQVTFCSTGGLGVLLGVQNRAKALGITVALTGLRPPMTRLLLLSGLNHRFPTIENPPN